MEVGTILQLVEWAIEEEPKVADALKNVFSKPNPTTQDWANERAAWSKKYTELVPDSKLPQGS